MSHEGAYQPGKVVRLKTTRLSDQDLTITREARKTALFDATKLAMFRGMIRPIIFLRKVFE